MTEIMVPQPIVRFEKPEKLTYKNVIYWSPIAQALQGVKEGDAILTKAQIFLKRDLVFYDSTAKIFVVRHIPGYNKTDYVVEPGEDGHWKCRCQFYNKVSKTWNHPRCSHITVVLLWLEINKWDRKNAKED